MLIAAAPLDVRRAVPLVATRLRATAHARTFVPARRHNLVIGTSLDPVDSSSPSCLQP